MTDELKTAYELAMERLRARGEGSGPPLSDDQKRRIAEVRREIRARLAELEVLHRTAVEAARAKGDAEKLERLVSEYESERRALLEKEEREVAAIRAESGA
ncbi:MAG: hypothetical protein D6718_10760 [Acidobacteria bacterium]|nr:MAG: hypothetical protein D6718_10760 [Acidobacteriota bacterium]